MSQKLIVKMHNCNSCGARSGANSMEGLLQKATTWLLVHEIYTVHIEQKFGKAMKNVI